MYVVFARAVLFLRLWIPVHDWYPHECCSGVDCFEINSERVEVRPDGFLLDRHLLIPFAQGRVSPDNKYHACFAYGALRRAGAACFWAPSGTM